MNTVMAGAKNMELDFCPRCDLVWLDTGEWSDLENSKAPVKTPDSIQSDKNQLEYAKLLCQMESAKIKTRQQSQSVPISDLGLWKNFVSFMGVPVEAEQDQFRSAPWITWLFLMICFVISWRGFRDPSFFHAMAFVSTTPLSDRLSSIFTMFFVHADFFHLIGNLYFLWIFGDNVEDQLGKTLYPVLILLSHLAGILFYTQFHHDAVPVVGASGGIFGIVTYYLIRFPFRKFIVRYFFIPFTIPALLLGALFVFKEFLGFLIEISVTKSGGIAHSAHLGGGAVGLIFAILFAPPRED